MVFLHSVVCDRGGVKVIEREEDMGQL